MAYIKCKCRHCGGAIEFSEEHAGEAIACPHCGKDVVLTWKTWLIGAIAVAICTLITLHEFAGLLLLAGLVATLYLLFRWIRRDPLALLKLGAVSLFIIGFGLAAAGCVAEQIEARTGNISAIRQTVYAVQYGSGFIVIGISFLLWAIIRQGKS